MGLFQSIKEFFLTESGRMNGKTLIVFHCNGCMATDWREADRGRIVGQVSRNSYNGSRDGCSVGLWVVERADGSIFECLAPNTQPGATDMQRYTDNPEEPLTGKMVCLM